MVIPHQHRNCSFSIIYPVVIKISDLILGHLSGLSLKQGKVEQEGKVLASVYLHTLQRTYQSQVDFGACIASNAKGKSIGSGKPQEKHKGRRVLGLYWREQRPQTTQGEVLGAYTNTPTTEASGTAMEYF
ncbi:corticotropin-releasing factor-binding protein [Limosa lapponica baueri]|uniref:Corticotropin-releasing factor-binding protein n=1 Tax=Limosa lapponica baueri TaxID=1758121 RepID=A0A2I0UEL2_LIMLA|nr:corticotropin-releasing factor-binding protein [Limosa lapponica baueri]